ncbi:MAG: phosphomannomutase/phosphoglucomutase [Acidobacteriota bacterium]
MSATAFRQYDVRGVVGRDLDEEFYHRLGLALGTRMARAGSRTVVVGRDARESSPAFTECLRKGLLETGRRVIDLGLITTPMTIFGLNFLQAEASVAVTASHNPAEYNGAKIRHGGSDGVAPVYGEQLQDLRALFESGDFEKGEGRLDKISIDDAYRTAIVGRVTPSRAMKVVVDAGNGSGGLVAPDILDQLGFDVVPLFCEVDGSFPNHHPDPTKLKNLQDLAEKIRDEGADCGVALDGDADRMVLVDETGGVHWPDRILMALTKAELPRLGGGLVVCDVKCSQGVAEVAESVGGRAVMTKTGYPFLLEAMADPDAVFGIELSGHQYFGRDRLFDFDDGVHSAARTLEVFSRDSRPVSAQMADLPSYVATPEIRATCPEERKFAVTDELVAAFRDDSELVSLLDTDGARATYPEGWGLVRASNTEPSLVMVFESKTEDGLAKLKSRFAEKVSAFPEIEVDLS